MSDSEEFVESFVVRDWDSQFFGFKVAQSELETATADEVRTMLSRCKSQGVRCLYFLANPSSQETLSALTSNKFKLVDVRVQMAMGNLVRSKADSPDVQVREATAADSGQLVDASAESFSMSRFYSDPGFSRRKCLELYQRWIVNDCSGINGAKTFIAESKGSIAGYCSCGKMGSMVRTGLTWVSPEFRGKGISYHAFVAVENWSVDQRANCLMAVTQGSNVASVRMHQSFGFKFDSAKLWFHRWF